MNHPVFIANDHAGFQLKSFLLQSLSEVNWIDLGSFNDQSVDYPEYASILCEKMYNSTHSCGVLICGSGQGMAMRANKYSHIRAALVWSLETTEMARKHNDANVLCLGARLTEPTLAKELIRLFLATPFEGGRHEKRVQLLSSKVK